MQLSHVDTSHYGKTIIESTVIDSVPGSSIGLATHTTGWTVWESNPGGGKNFYPSRLDLAPTQPPVQWVPGLSRGQSAAGA
jgi:hypothetical protein